MSEDRIRRLLETRLDAWAESQNLRVAHQNEAFTPPASDAYLRAFLLSATPTDEFLEGGHTAFVGVFQVSVLTALNEGTGPAGVIIEGLRTLFPNLLPLTDLSGFKVTVMSPLSVPSGFPDDAHWLTPTSFEYRADTTS